MSRKKRIFVTGSHSVGKTTLVDELATLLSRTHDVGVIPETARILASRGFSVNDDISAEGVDVYLKVYERNFCNTGNAIVIADRGIMDLYIYTKHLYNDAELGRELGGIVLERAKEDLRRFDLVAFVPVQIPLIMDGVRPVSTLFQKEIERRALEFLDQEKIAYVTAGGTLADRVACVTHALDRSGKLSLEGA